MLQLQGQGNVPPKYHLRRYPYGNYQTLTTVRLPINIIIYIYQQVTAALFCIPSNCSELCVEQSCLIWHCKQETATTFSDHVTVRFYQTPDISNITSQFLGVQYNEVTPTMPICHSKSDPPPKKIG